MNGLVVAAAVLLVALVSVAMWRTAVRIGHTSSRRHEVGALAALERATERVRER